MKQKGWPRESARHSLAGRGVRTKRPQSQHAAAVPTGQKKNPLKEQPKPEEALKTICAELEEAAVNESGSEEGGAELLADGDWVETHIDELIRTFQFDNGLKNVVIAQLRKKYKPDGE